MKKKGYLLRSSRSMSPKSVPLSVMWGPEIPRGALRGTTCNTNDNKPKTRVPVIPLRVSRREPKICAVSLNSQRIEPTFIADGGFPVPGLVTKINTSGKSCLVQEYQTRVPSGLRDLHTRMGSTPARRATHLPNNESRHFYATDILSLSKYSRLSFFISFLSLDESLINSYNTFNPFDNYELWSTDFRVK